MDSNTAIAYNRSVKFNEILKECKVSSVYQLIQISNSGQYTVHLTTTDGDDIEIGIIGGTIYRVFSRENSTRKYDFLINILTTQDTNGAEIKDYYLLIKGISGNVSIEVEYYLNDFVLSASKLEVSLPDGAPTVSVSSGVQYFNQLQLNNFIVRTELNIASLTANTVTTDEIKIGNWTLSKSKGTDGKIGLSYSQGA